MTDWRELTGRDLEIEIAKRRGYRVECREALHVGHWYQLIYPDGREANMEYGRETTEADAWEVYCPHYLSDANAIRELMKDILGSVPTSHVDSFNHTAAKLTVMFCLDKGFEAICRWWMELQERGE